MKTPRHIVGITTILLCTSCPPLFAGDPRSASEPELKLPADTEIVLTVNLDKVLNSPLGKKYLRDALDEALKHNPHGQEALNYLGLDPMRDIVRMTMAMSSTRSDEGLIIISGKFNRAKIDDLAQKVAADQKDKLKIHKNNGSIVYEITGDKTMFATLPDDSTVLLSKSREQLTAQRTSPKAELSALIAKTDGRQAIWFAVLPEVTKALPSTDDAQKKALENLDGITGTVKVESSIRLQVDFLSKTVQSAAATGKMLTDFLGIAKVFGPQAVKDKPELSPLLDVVNSIRVAVHEKAATITAECTGEQIDKAVQSIGK